MAATDGKAESASARVLGLARERLELTANPDETGIAAILARAPLLLFRYDGLGILQECHGPGLRLPGLALADAIGRPVTALLPGCEDELARVRAGEELSFRTRKASSGRGGRDWVLDVHLLPGDVDGGTGLVLDVTGQARDDQALLRSLHADPLTGLNNRLYLTEWMQSRAGALGDRFRCTLFYLDIVGFREINEVFGYALGDEVLKACADRLRRVCPKGGVLARIGDDSFSILLEGSTDRNTARQVAVDMIAAVETPLMVQGEEVHIGCNVGVVIHPEHVDSVERMFRAAELTLTKALGLGRGEYAFYSEDLERRVQRNRSVATAIRHGLAEDRFRLAYQPKVDAMTGRVVGVEALLRYADDTGLGEAAPEGMIAVAETTRLIEPIGAWALDEAARWLGRWRSMGHPISVAVNVSAVQMRYAMQPTGLVNVVRDCLGEIRAPAPALEIEVTESTFMDARSRLAMRRLAELGVTMVVDDFGTGWSSFSYLKDLEVDALKIDRSFVGWSLDGAAEFAICRSLIELGHALGLRVIAEGVETLEQATLLRDAGCDELQGFLFCQALPPEEIERLLNDPAPFADLLKG